MAVPSFKLRVKGAFPLAFIVPNVPVGAPTEDLAAILEVSESGKAVGFKAATCNIFLLDAAGAHHPLDPAAVFPAAPGNRAPPAAGSTVNVWIETPATGSEELLALREAILATEKEGDFITLPEGAEWPQLGAVPLFVRHFYDGCYTGPLQSLTADKKAELRKFVILGNAGIGKSAFGSYLLYRAIREGRTVVYQSAKLDTAFVFHSNGAVEEVDNIYSKPTRQLLKDYSTVFISDSITPKCVHAFTVLITSPKLERWTEFYKEPDCERLFFSVYSWKEIVALQEGCFPDVAGGLEGVAARHARWGGIPRYVLAKTRERAQKRLEAALTKPDYAQLADILGKEELESEVAVSHRLLHLKVRGELEAGLEADSIDYYDLARTELGSSYIADKVCEALMASADNQLRSLLSLSPRPPSAAKLFGEVFERAALKALAAGGTFRIRALQPDGKGVERDLHLPPAVAPVAGFRTVEELAALAAAPAGGAAASAAPARLLRPTSKSFCAVDFILQGRLPANATVDKAHGLILKGKSNTPSGLLPVAEALGLGKALDFFWIVPEADFGDWKLPQRLLVKSGAAESTKARKIAQYALSVRFEAPALVAPAACAVCGAAASGGAGGGLKRGREEEAAGGAEAAGGKPEKKKR